MIPRHAAAPVETLRIEPALPQRPLDPKSIEAWLLKSVWGGDKAQAFSVNPDGLFR